MRLLTLALIFAIPTVSFAQPQMQCGKRDQVTAKLEKQYSEFQRGAGLGGGMIFELWTNGDTGSWTILLTRPDGVSCIYAAGEDWQDASPIEETGDPA